MSDEKDAPDFAMLRAVEILANIYERQSGKQQAPPPPLDKPIVAFNERITFAVGVTTREEVERELGIAFAYPARGWHTYAAKGRNGTGILMSVFYSEGTIASVELYVPQAERAPKLAPRDLHVRLVPSEIEVGAQVASLPDHFGRISMPVAGRATFDAMFEARFPGGAAYAMANAGVIERLALYVLREAAPKA